MCFRRFIIYLCTIFTFQLACGQSWELSDPIKLPDAINSNAEESTPLIYLNKNIKELYFVRTFDERNTGGVNDQDIWVSVMQRDGNWSNAIPVKNLNNQNNNAIGGFSKTKAYVLYSDRKQKSPAIKSSQLQNAKMRSPERWDIPVKSDFDFSKVNLNDKEMGFTISKDEKFMILSLMNEGGNGMEDLYVYDVANSVLTSLGPEINSNGYEISPFLSESGDTLYFSSDGLGGEGDADIFYCVKGKDWAQWSKPVNMGSKINSTGFDAYLIKSENSFYWSSNRNSNQADIYTAKLIPPKLTIKLKGTDVTVFKGSDGTVVSTVYGGVGPYRYKWNNGMSTKDISSLVKGKYSVMVTDAIGQIARDTIDIAEPPPIIEKTIIRLPEVRYALNTWKFINDEKFHSMDSLDQIAKLLEKYPRMVLELISHTDSRGDEKSNLELSQNRSRAVYTYLVKKKNIDGRRLIPVGKGESQPAEILDTLTKKLIQLSEPYINSFEKNNLTEFERLHQINRRTEGRIISMEFNPEKAAKLNENFFIDIGF